MRFSAAGILFLLFLASSAVAQVTGFVESIGIQNHIRPDCWNPLIVNLTSQISEPKTYQVQVWQEDLDKDHVVYTREITLSPKLQEKFEVYFVPEPTVSVRDFRGLPALPDQVTAGDLQKALQVRVCLPQDPGRKPEDAKVVLDRLPITYTIDSVDPPRAFAEHEVGTREILWVTDGSSMPSFGGYQKALGLAERVEPLAVRPADLGENPLYYDAVDAVIWLSGNADDLDKSGAHRREALEEFVRAGGKLVVCQPGDRQKIEALASILPVELKDAGGNWAVTFSDKAKFVDQRGQPSQGVPIDALPELAASPNSAYRPSWHLMKGPIPIARARPKAGAVVDLRQYWSKDDASPYIVRGSHGLGCVTWIAQDLGDINLTGPLSDNWPHIWDRVIGWNNISLTPIDAPAGTQAGDALRKPFEPEVTDPTVDFSVWMLSGADYASKGAAYIFVAIVFFILYWLGSGPGTYMLLAGKKRKELNWFIFGAWAFAGTAVTVVLVKLILHGDPEARHLSVIRGAEGQPSYVYSRVGLYIPRDGDQTISLADTSTDAISYVTPLQIHPEYVVATDFPAAQQYAIPVHDDPQPVSVHIPFRTTLKKLQARWVGDVKGGIGGSTRLIAFNKGAIAGSLVNQTGADLKDIYVAFNYVSSEGADDRVLFIPTWPSGKTIDLNKEYMGAKDVTSANPSSRGDPLKGPIRGIAGWEGKWHEDWGNGGIIGNDTRGAADFEKDVPRAFPIMSLFDRIAPARGAPGNHRTDFIRRGGTILNMSAAVEAGKVVILAQSADDERPVPFPLTVDGSRVEGKGRVLYQFALTPDRTEMEKDAGR
jgi:hypothetical protein